MAQAKEHAFILVKLPRDLRERLSRRRILDVDLDVNLVVDLDVAPTAACAASRRWRRFSATITVRATLSAVTRIHARSVACVSTIGGLAASFINIS